MHMKIRVTFIIMSLSSKQIKTRPKKFDWFKYNLFFCIILYIIILELEKYWEISEKMSGKLDIYWKNLLKYTKLSYLANMSNLLIFSKSWIICIFLFQWSLWKNKLLCSNQKMVKFFKKINIKCYIKNLNTIKTTFLLLLLI